MGFFWAMLHPFRWTRLFFLNFWNAEIHAGVGMPGGARARGAGAIDDDGEALNDESQDGLY